MVVAGAHRPRGGGAAGPIRPCMQDLPSGGNYFFFGGGLAMGVRRHASPKKKFNGAIWCVFEHIFINILLSKSPKIYFIQK